MRNASPEQMDLDTNRVEVHWTVLARAEEERLIRKCAAVVKRMRSATFLQRNVSKGGKNGLMELEELLDCSCVLCRDRGASGESVAHTAGSGRGPIFRAELERARVRTP